MLKKLILVAVALAAVLALIGLVLPSRVVVTRTASIDAPREDVFAIVNGFVRFNQWSPWFELDPNATYVVEGPAAGVGAVLRWQGDPDAVGSGTLRIVESRAPELVTMEVSIGPVSGRRVQLALAEEGRGTRVTWSLDTEMGANPFARYAGLLFDWFIGRDFDKGLARLKELAERPGEGAGSD